jgi:NAD(P)-dependent dehydrogenase (short-subunit alcohol dehydrogenase family)
MVMTQYLAHELKPYNIAANILNPGSSATTGSEEQIAGRRARLARLGQPVPEEAPRRWDPKHVVPLALFLADQDASSLTGEAFSAGRWNEQNELGGWEVWGWGPDVEAHRAAGTLDAGARRR